MMYSANLMLHMDNPDLIKCKIDNFKDVVFYAYIYSDIVSKIIF